MTASRKFTLIWLLLPLLALRGMVPAGFMVDTSGGRLSIVLCGGNGPLMAAVDHAQMDHGQMGHDQMEHAQHHGGEHEKHKNSMCPFAFAGTAAALASIHSLPIGIEPVRIAAATNIAAFHGLFGPSRAQQSRAPPSFSFVS